MLAQEIIRIKRDGGTLSRAHFDAFVAGLVDGSWSEGQAAAMAMAVFLKGLSKGETVALTRAMQHSGEVLDWAASALHGPVLDKPPACEYIAREYAQLRSQASWGLLLI